MKKGIATETIVKLMICLIALGILTFLLYKYVLSSELDCRACATKMTAWCTQCQIAEWSGGKAMDDKLNECRPECLTGVSEHGDCEGTAKDDCSGFLPSIS